ncbi:MAG: hypothetical protein P8045_08325 [Candidatus Thiodiazotropha sp.]|jgi:hypothetical protein
MNWPELLIVIVDKLLIGVLILIVGFWINRKLHEYKIGLEENVGTRVRIAERRLPSYRKLWELTSPTTHARTKELSDIEKKELYDQLCKWYYETGNGIFLSNETRKLYLDSRESLLDENVSDEDITRIFSRLRTEIKNEIGIYGKRV